MILRRSFEFFFGSYPAVSWGYRAIGIQVAKSAMFTVCGSGTIVKIVVSARAALSQFLEVGSNAAMPLDFKTARALPAGLPTG
jgi:hypothetical protein